MRQLADDGLKVQFVSGDGIITNRLASIAGDAVTGTLNTFAPQAGNNPANKYLVEKFRAAGIEPVEYAFNAYAAVQSIAAGATAAKSNHPKAVAKAMKEKGRSRQFSVISPTTKRATPLSQAMQCTNGRRQQMAHTATTSNEWIADIFGGMRRRRS